MSVKELRPGGSVPPNGTGNGQRPSHDGPLAKINKAIYRQAPEVWDNLHPRVLGHNVYKSVYRTTAFPKTERERSEAFFNSFLLHIQPAKIEKHALRFTYTFGLGLLSLYLFLILTVSGPRTVPGCAMQPPTADCWRPDPQACTAPQSGPCADPSDCNATFSD